MHVEQGAETVVVALLPVVTFSTVAVPFLLLLDLTVTVITSPEVTEREPKFTCGFGNWTDYVSSLNPLDEFL